MSIAVLPFNAGPNTRPTLARQFANFAAEIVRARTGTEVHSVNYLLRIDEQNPPRFANVNPSEGLNEAEMVTQLFGQTDAVAAMDGLLLEKDGGFELTVRLFDRGTEAPVSSETYTFNAENALVPMRQIVSNLATKAGGTLPAETSSDLDLFGTENSSAFLKFLEGYDALQYIEKTQGAVVNEFAPQFAYDALQESVLADRDWEAPYATLLQLSRACAQFRIGSAEAIEAALAKAIEIEPEDARAQIVLGELFQAVGDLNKALAAYEAAMKLDPNEPALYTRMGIVQGQMNLPANAEQSFRKAMELEPDDKPSTGFLANVLAGTNRAHEVPPLWRAILDKNEKNSQAWANYGASLMAAENSAEALRTFDEGLEKAEDAAVVKRAYAPALASVQEWDRAMDLYEDCLDLEPTNIQLLLEYASTLQNGGRQFEVAKVLRDVLGANPDPNTRAQTLAWLVELEQPKRVESVASAQDKMNAEDFDGAVKILRPMRNWLADYWKMWALYAAALNRSGDHREAEDAANRLVQLFPGHEAGFIELGNSLMAQERFDEAYNAMRYAMANIQGSLGIAVQFGLSARRSGHTDEAAEMARQIRAALGENEELEPALKEMEG